jgi:hypothetical protein
MGCRYCIIVTVREKKTPYILHSSVPNSHIKCTMDTEDFRQSFSGSPIVSPPISNYYNKYLRNILLRGRKGFAVIRVYRYLSVSSSPCMKGSFLYF